MYLSTVRGADAAGPPTGTAKRVSGTVVGLGTVSMITDVSAEMVTAVLPLYLVYGVGIGYLRLGAIDGLYTGATAVLRLVGGHVADRLGRPKAVAVAGYALSAVAKLGFPLAGGSVAGTGAVIAVDRAGKGIRTAPRDAMITLATPDDQLGRAFGVHRAMDTAGALLGPLLAFALVAGLAVGFDAVFAVSFLLGVVGVLVLVFFVSAPAGPAPARERVALRACGVLVRDRRLLRACLVAGLLGLLTVGDMFLYVALQVSAGLPPGVLPLLPLGTAAVFMAAAAPVGRAADRVGRARVFLAGHVLLVAAYLLLAGAVGGWVGAGAVLLCHGLFYACTDGVLMALAGPLVPAELRGTGLALAQTAQALARAGGAVVFGLVAALSALRPAFLLFAGLLVVAVAVGAWVGRRSWR